MSQPVSAQNVAQLMAPSPRTSGSVLWGATTVTLPTTSYVALVGGTGGLVDLGYLDENGLKQKEDRSNTDVFAWGGDLVGTLQDKYSRTMTFRLLQFNNSAVQAASHGISNVSVTAANTTAGNEISVKLNAALLDTRAWVFDGIYGIQLCRVVIPIGRVVQVGEIDMTHKAYSSVECTLKAYPDAQRNHGYMYLNDGAVT
jgi:hypothetical protein